MVINLREKLYYGHIEQTFNRNGEFIIFKQKKPYGLSSFLIHKRKETQKEEITWHHNITILDTLGLQSSHPVFSS